jgi:hypothetical protein
MTSDSHLPDLDRIARTVETCIAYAAKSERPFQQTTDLILMLKNTPGWTDAEIFEVQGRIMDALFRRAIERESGSESKCDS